MQQALEALNRSDYLGWQFNIPIIKALRERLAKEDEPVVFNTVSSLRHKKTVGPIESAMTGRPQTAMQPCAGRNCGSTNPNLHSAECFEDYEKSTGVSDWKGLTEEEVMNCYMFWVVDLQDIMGFYKGVETKLKEKNT
jgi:hypothetical protein